MSTEITTSLPVQTLHDKMNVALRPNDYVLVAHNGPYLNFGRVTKIVDYGGRIGVEIQEAFQPQNDPTKPFEARRQTICTPHRVVRIQREQVPWNLVTLIAHDPV